MDDHISPSSFQGLGLDTFLLSSPSTALPPPAVPGTVPSPLSAGASSPRSQSAVVGSPLSQTDGVMKLVRPSPRSRLFSLAQRESSGASTAGASNTESSVETSPQTLMDFNYYPGDKRSKSDGDLTEYLNGFSHLLNAIYQAKTVCNQELIRISHRLDLLSNEISRYQTFYLTLAT
jgi:hypothetical protein